MKPRDRKIGEGKGVKPSSNVFLPVNNKTKFEEYPPSSDVLIMNTLVTSLTTTVDKYLA